MSQKDVLPVNDLEFDSFQGNFITEVTANKVAWKIDVNKLSALTPFQTKWNTAWAICKVKGNATAAQRATKDLAKKLFIEELRPFIQSEIQTNTYMTDEDRIGCGIKPRKDTRTPAKKPTDSPTVTAENKDGEIVKVYLRQQPGNDGSSRRGKPEGVTACKVVYIVGTAAPAAPKNCTELAESGKATIELQFDTTQKGKTVFGFCCWVNSLHVDGPWSDIFSKTIS